MKMCFYFVLTITAAIFVVSVTILSSTLGKTPVISLEHDDLRIGELEPLQTENQYNRLNSPMDVSSRTPKCKKGCYRISAGKCKCTRDPTDFDDYYDTQTTKVSFDDFYDGVQNKTTVPSFEKSQMNTISPASLSFGLQPGNNKNAENTSWSVEATNSPISSHESIIDDSQSGLLSAEKSVASINQKVVCLILITLLVTMLL